MYIRSFLCLASEKCYIHIAKASKQQQHGEAVNCKARSLHSRRNFIGLQSCCWYYCSSRLCRQQQPAYVALPAKGIVYLDKNLPRKPQFRVWSFSCTKKKLILVLQCCGIIVTRQNMFFKSFVSFLKPKPQHFNE